MDGREVLELAHKLKGLRVAKGLTTRQLADICGFSQSKISKIETGRTVPLLRDIDEILSAVDARSSVAESLRQDCISLRSTITRPKLGQKSKYEFVAEVHEDSTVIKTVSWTIIEAVFQTPAYVARLHALYAIRELSQRDYIAARLKRQALSFERRRTHQVVLDERALTTLVLPPHLQIAQLEAIKTRLKLPGIDLGIFPADQVVAVAPVQVGIFDNQLSIREQGDAFASSRDHRRLVNAIDDFNTLEKASVWEGEAVELIDQAIDRLVSISNHS